MQRLDARQRLRDGLDARGARAVAAAGEQRLLVEPDEVAALGDGGLVHCRGDGTPAGSRSRATAAGSVACPPSRAA